MRLRQLIKLINTSGLLQHLKVMRPNLLLRFHGNQRDNLYEWVTGIENLHFQIQKAINPIVKHYNVETTASLASLFEIRHAWHTGYEFNEDRYDLAAICNIAQALFNINRIINKLSPLFNPRIYNLQYLLDSIEAIVLQILQDAKVRLELQKRRAEELYLLLTNELSTYFSDQEKNKNADEAVKNFSTNIRSQLQELELDEKSDIFSKLNLLVCKLNNIKASLDTKGDFKQKTPITRQVFFTPVARVDQNHTSVLVSSIFKKPFHGKNIAEKNLQIEPVFKEDLRRLQSKWLKPENLDFRIDRALGRDVELSKLLKQQTKTLNQRYSGLKSWFCRYQSKLDEFKSIINNAIANIFSSLCDYEEFNAQLLKILKTEDVWSEEKSSFSKYAYNEITVAIRDQIKAYKKSKWTTPRKQANTLLNTLDNIAAEDYIHRIYLTAAALIGTINDIAHENNSGQSSLSTRLQKLLKITIQYLPKDKLEQLPLLSMTANEYQNSFYAINQLSCLQRRGQNK